MALRQVRVDGDEILRKISKEVTVIDDKIKELIEDMFETMYHEEGVGLAAPQIGVLKRILVIDTEEDKRVMINPVIMESDGEELGYEGCLSIPEFEGQVKRPTWLKVKYKNENDEEVVEEISGFLARVVCHEVDHLNGILFKDKVIEDKEGIV